MGLLGLGGMAVLGMNEERSDLIGEEIEHRLKERYPIRLRIMYSGCLVVKVFKKSTTWAFGTIGTATH